MKILVIGDVIEDSYHFGSVERISPEAPVPVFDWSGKEDRRLGGAANVAQNIKSISPKCTVHLVGFCSYQTDLMKDIIPAVEGCFDYSAIKKTRLVVQDQQLLRIDYPKKYQSEISIDDLSDKNLEEYNLIVVSDYNKGTIGKNVISRLTSVAKAGKKVLIEAKNASKYATIMGAIYKCNQKEAEAQELDIVKSYPFSCVIVTKSDKGYSLYTRKGSYTSPSSIDQDDILDVVGAGDVFLAGMAVRLCEGAEVAEAAEFGNICAGISVKKFGTVCVKQSDLVKK